MMTDPIADMLTRIRNGQAVKKARIILPYSKIKHEIAKVLMHEGYVGEVTKTAGPSSNIFYLEINLKYDETGKALISHLQRVSLPSRRVYVGREEIPYILDGYGKAILSTSHGIMTNEQARRAKVGGEVICEVW